MQAQRIVIKNAALFILISIFLCYLLFSFSFSLRTYAYQVFKKGVNLYLNYKTRSFEMIESENFTIKYLPEDESIAAFVLNIAEKYYPAVQDIMEYRPKEKVSLIIYPDQESLNKSFGWAGDKSAVGVYWADSIRLLSPFAWIKGADNIEEIKTQFMKESPLSHELTHFVIDEQTGGNYTRWLTEGLAQYVEEKTTGFTLEEPLTEQQRNLYSLERLEKEYDSLPDQLLVYWQSLQTVRCLIDDYGMEKMHGLLTELGQGKKMETAFREIYGLTLPGLEKRIKAYTMEKLIIDE